MARLETRKHCTTVVGVEIVVCERSTWRVDSNVARTVLRWLMTQNQPATVREIANAVGAP